MAGVPPLHGLGWLCRLDDGSLAFTGELPQEALDSPSGLGEGSYELHWLPSPSDARSFAAGIAIARRNSVTAHVGIHGAECAALVHFADRETALDASTLEEAIPLVEHAPASRRRALLKWRHHEDSVLALAISRSASVKPIHVTGKSEDRLDLKVHYPYWEFTKEYSHIRLGGAIHVAIVEREGKHWIEVRDSSFHAALRREDFRPELQEAVTAVGGNCDSGQVTLPVEGDLAKEFARYYPLYMQLWDIDNRARNEDALDKIRRHPENLRIARALGKGAVLASDGTLTLPDGTERKVSSGRIADMARAGMILPAEVSTAPLKP